MVVELSAAAVVGAVGVPVKAGEVASTVEPVPVATADPVPPCATDNGVVNPVKEVILLLAPEDAAPLTVFKNC